MCTLMAQFRWKEPLALWVVDNAVPLMRLCVALDALCIWAEPALLVSVYEQLYELVAALPTENDGEALNSAIDWG